jgi:hypothetical protein
VLLLVAQAVPARAQEDRSESRRMMAVLGLVTSRSEIDAFVGKPADRCLPGQPSFDLCEWTMGNDMPGWKALSWAIESRDRIVLLCELPIDDSPRAEDSCGAYPMRSNRDAWKVQTMDNGRRRRSADISRDKAQNQRRAVKMLERAQTLAGLSMVAGALPDECTPTPGGARSCLWRTTARTWGHGTLATTIGAPYGKKVRMLCILPAGGTPRPSGSCQVEIGA